MDHPCSQCKYRSYTCHTCGRLGHISDTYKRKSGRSTMWKRHKLHKVTSIETYFLSLYNISTQNHGIKVPIELNRIHLPMEVDTGTSILLISQETYNKHFKETPLPPSNTRLHSYTGHPVQVSGQFPVQLKHQNQIVNVPLIVIEGSGLSPFGRNWLSHVKLDWKRICNIPV